MIESEFLSYINVRVSILSASDVDNINIDQWNGLTDKSFFNNPFFSPNWLISSIKYFTSSDNVYVVTLYRDDELIGLFPVIKMKAFKFFSFLMIWQHNHSFDVNPLISRDLDFFRIFKYVATKLGCYAGRIHLHNAELMAESASSIFTTQYSRAYIQNTNELTSYINSLSGKFGRENKRLYRNAQSNLKLTVNRFSNAEDGLNAFMQLEHSGWKGRGKGSILSNRNVAEFYKNITRTGWGDTAFEVTGLSDGPELIACAIRIKSKNKYFEIKTTYHEGYHQYAPGRILEYLILKDLSCVRDVSVDSCTNENNTLINKLWPNQVTLLSSLVYSDTLLGQISNKLYQLKWRAHRPNA